MKINLNYCTRTVVLTHISQCIRRKSKLFDCDERCFLYDLMVQRIHAQKEHESINLIESQMKQYRQQANRANK